MDGFNAGAPAPGAAAAASPIGSNSQAALSGRASIGKPSTKAVSAEAPNAPAPAGVGAHLERTSDGLALVDGDMVIRGDFTRMLPRAKQGRLQQELLVKAVKPSSFFAAQSGVGAAAPAPLAIDATAGLGDDAFLLAACGFEVLMFERDETIAALLGDAFARAKADGKTASIANRMRLAAGDSIAAMQDFARQGGETTRNDARDIDQNARCGINDEQSSGSAAQSARTAEQQTKGAAPTCAIDRTPSVVLLDPMFPARTKSAAVKKKFQLIHQLEKPCTDEEELLQAALLVGAAKVIVKRPAKGPFLAGKKPSYSISGKAVRYDILVPAQMKL